MLGGASESWRKKYASIVNSNDNDDDDENDGDE